MAIPAAPLPREEPKTNPRSLEDHYPRHGHAENAPVAVFGSIPDHPEEGKKTSGTPYLHLGVMFTRARANVRALSASTRSPMNVAERVRRAGRSVTGKRGCPLG